MNRTSSRSNLDKIGKFSVDMLTTRVRLGKGVVETLGSEKALKKLDDKTKKQRKKAKLSPFTRPGKSNLTKTGKMLDAMFHIVRPISKSVSISIRNSARSDTKITNKRLAEIHHSEKDRPFFHMSRRDFKKIFQFVKREIVKPLIDKFS